MGSMNNFTRHNIVILAKTIFLCIILSLPSFCFAQQGTITGTGKVTYNPDGSVTVKGKSTFTSHVAQSVEDVENMVQLDAISLFRVNADLQGGVKSYLADPASEVSISIFAYNSATEDHKGALLYKIVAKTPSSTDFVGHPVYVPVPNGSGTIGSDQIKTLLQGADTWLADRSVCDGQSKLDLLTTTLDYINGQTNPSLNTPLNNCLKGNNYKLTQPVIVQVDVTNARVLPFGLKFPGMIEEYDLWRYFDQDYRLKVFISVNGAFKSVYYAGNKDPDPLDLVMGDSVTYEVSYYGRNAPKIEGVPGVWIARFAGDLMYYCSPSVTPNEFNPWIGYDSRVHTLQLRNKSGDPSFRERVPNWTHKPVTARWTWSWTAQRRMDATKPKYQASYNWKKYKVLNNGSLQRNNQKEGLNVQFLNYWQNGENSDFKEYKGLAKYMMGFDDDELLYLNSQYYDAINHPPLPGGGISKLDSIPSRGMPEGADQLYDIRSGYPAQGFPLNKIISAYRKNREWVVNNNDNYFKKYDGYEIQDTGTDENNPDGTGNGNNAAPGTVTVRAGYQVVTIKFNVKAPLTTDKGHYGSLEGNRWPAYYENDIAYTLNGLKGLSVTELDKFSMEYAGSDAMGNLKSQTKLLKDLSASEKADVSSTGNWSAKFNNITPAYSAVTAYYQRNSTASRVIVSGKELKPIFLLFLGEKGFEGKGLGAKIWLNDFRDVETDEYYVQRKFGNKTKYMKPFVRTYTLPVNTTTTFESWDGDPHLFYDPGTEWFLSSRTLAKRIPDSYLDGTNTGAEKPYLKYYVDGAEQTNGRSGKEFTYTWSTPGIHKLTVEYRIDGNLTKYEHQINVVNYPKIGDNQQIGNIISKKMTAQQAQWLGVANPAIYKVLEVVDVYSTHQYKDGPRATDPYVNRWAEFNDYAGKYVWSLTDNDVIKNFVENYNDRDWFWFNWALHYSSNWRDHLPNGLPVYVGDDQVTRVFTTELDKFAAPIKELFKSVNYANWQYTVPLVSYTDFQGNRMRTNPSCLYDINTIWSNTDGAFSGNVKLPDDPNQIQAPDISDEQKDRQEFYYDIISGRKVVLPFNSSTPIHISVRNIYKDKNIFIAETDIDNR
ncbi:hypothetical protein ACR777_02540 [Sphingobacterium spiritivorum]|uniref:hypothetical protein n=1 Tax=Sphingobacterium spiritivorum TaxID=258 RepID=UPI003DA6701A